MKEERRQAMQDRVWAGAYAAKSIQLLDSNGPWDPSRDVWTQVDELATEAADQVVAGLRRGRYRP